MGKRGGSRKVANSAIGSSNTISLREETTGKKQQKRGGGGGGGGGSSSNAKHLLKVEHLEKLAIWASGEASIPSLAAFFGQRLASVGESLGVSPNPSLFSCRRCETILQPGFNCTVRIEKNKAKARRRSKSKKSCSSTKNNVVYSCHYCSRRNVKGGTPKGHIKQICPSKIKTTKISKPTKSKSQKPVSSQKDSRGKDEVNKKDEPALPVVDEVNNKKDEPTLLSLLERSEEFPIIDSTATPVVRIGTTLLEAKKRKRNRSTTKKPAESEDSSIPTNSEKTSGMSSKRRRKSWTTLKEIADSKEQGKKQDITTLPIPFFL
ncbi:RNAse P, Rpr2/Rpp21 subunit [Parasponia andersonii]|uniref:RNAse P, Rpr2/Rpp21 subunit n=1 Tax=Parasponia andersonii TaxID=3476 RepID=A0A2P5CP93_PARAD|nr:RNAse P, Rpr2/Rpp21 subunit [Parasponia andersonii]